MTKHRSHSATFMRQVVQEFVAGDTLNGLLKLHDISRQLIRIWSASFETGPHPTSGIVPAIPDVIGR